MAKQNNQKPTEKPSKPRIDENKGRTIPKPRIKPKK